MDVAMCRGWKIQPLQLSSPQIPQNPAQPETFSSRAFRARR
jgi:hypothetical protein